MHSKTAYIGEIIVLCFLWSGTDTLISFLQGKFIPYFVLLHSEGQEKKVLHEDQSTTKASLTKKHACKHQLFPELVRHTRELGGSLLFKKHNNSFWMKETMQTTEEWGREM